MSKVAIDELKVPESVGAPGWAEFARAIEVGTLVGIDSFGTPDIAYEPAEELTNYRSPFQPTRLFVAREADDIVGCAWTETQVGDASDTSWAMVQVLPQHRGRGIGRALADRVEEAVAGDDRRKIVAYVAGRDVGGRRIPSPTGYGSIAADTRETRFLQARSYSFEQVERVSRLPLPVPGIEDLLASASAASGPDYAVHTWVGRTPDRWLEDLALLITRMSTDAPTAGLEEPEDVWTVERLAAEDERREGDSPRRHLTAAAEHLPSGRLAAFTEFSVPRETHRAAMQYATLVLREHRGHRLGMLVKVANLAHLAAYSPGHPSILTFNAEENRRMLDVNEALGFTPIAYEGAWRKDLS